MIFLAHVFALSAFAQDDPIPKLRDKNNPFIKEKAIHVSDNGGVIYFCNCVLKSGELFTTYKISTGLKVDDEMIEVKTWQDNLPEEDGIPTSDFYHKQYQQYHKGIPIRGALYTEHYQIDGQDACVFATSGVIVENLNIEVEPTITKSSALEVARQIIGTDSIKWDSSSGELVLIYKGNDSVPLPEGFKLAYRFSLNAFLINKTANSYIDAHTGDLVTLEDVYNQDGTFQHMYYGTKTDLDTYYNDRLWPLSDRFHLFANNSSYSRNIYTDDFEDDDNFTGWNWERTVMPYCEDTDVWGTAEHFKATSTHYCAQKSWDFYKDYFKHYGMTGISGGWGRHIRVRANSPQSGAGYLPWYGEDYIIIGKYNGNYLSTYDVVGHEYTHGVINRHSALPNEKASGAINESFADIMGLMVERYAKGGLYNWTIGKDATALRSMDNPNAYGQPSYYLQSGYWFNLNSCTSELDTESPNYNDGCGVHTNSGVINKWFNLLSMGGSQIISGQNRTVLGIGIDKAASIVYLSMTGYLNYDMNNLNFNAVRDNTLVVAAQRFGLYSQEYYSVCRAWWAVNVGTGCSIPFNPNVSLCAWKPDARITEFTGNFDMDLGKYIKVLITPNPIDDIVNIRLEEPNKTANNEYRVNIVDISGKLVFSEKYTDLTDLNIDINNLRSGIYFVNITSKNWFRNIKLIKK